MESGRIDRGRGRRLKAGWRDTLLLLDEFKWPLAAFAAVILLSSAAWTLVPKPPEEAHTNFGETVYRMIQLVFFQGGDRFPQTDALRVFYYALPILGLGILGLGLADFGAQLFNRRGRSKEWEMAVASTFRNHVVLIGMGHLGFRVANQLRDMGRELVVVELDDRQDLTREIRARDVPVIIDDAARDSVLLGAGIERARAIILAIQNDALNLKIALKARALNPQIDVIVRIFDDDFAEALRKQFGFTAMSATSLAAPFFAATAAGVDLSQPVTVDGHPLSVSRLIIAAGSSLSALTVGAVEQRYDVSVVMIHSSEGTDMHPPDARRLKAGDSVAVFGAPESVNRLAGDNGGR